MTIPEIIALAQAGFSAQQIAAMAAAPAPAPAPAPDPVADMLSKLGVQMSSLTSAIQSSNLLSAQHPQPQTADDILASIIAPPKKEEK